jgi:hypothetical protein
MPKSWTSFIAARCADGAMQASVMTVYYLAILVGLLVLYGAGDWSVPTFVYQGF